MTTDPRAATDPPLDDTCLEVLRGLDAAQSGFLAEILDVFLKDAEDRFMRIREGLAAGDADQVARAAHALKGASGGICAKRLSTLLSRIEEAGRTGDLANARAGLAAAEAEYVRVRSAIGTILGTDH